MAGNWLDSFAVALGFEVNTASLNTAKKSIADYEKAVKDAEKRIEDARWAGAKTEEEIAKLTREANLKEARAALAAAQEREKSEKETARRREERHKEFAAGMNRMALAAAAAATAIGYAVEKITSAFDNLGFVSQRTGASVQNLKALGYAFSQTGGSAQQAIGAIEKFAQAMRTNPGLKGFVKSLGVDTTKDMGDQYLDTVSALSKEPYYVGHQHAGMLGISEEDFKLVSDHLAQIRNYRDEYNRTTRSLGVDSQKAAEASQSFNRSLTRLQATASALTDKLLISLAPAIEAIVRRINEWIAANPDKIERIMRGIVQATDAVAAGLNKVADWFGDAENQRAMGEFWDKLNRYISDTVKSITDLIRLFDKLDKIFGFKPGDDVIGVLATRALGNQQQGGGSGADNRTWWQRHAPKALGGKDAPDPGDLTGGRATRQRGENKAGAKESYDFWRSKGLDHVQAAGLVAMEEGESNFNPRAVGDGGAARGAFQHHPDRRRDILRGTGIDIDRATHLQQLEAAYWEMTQGPDRQARQAWEAIRRAKTPGASTSAGVYKFERPSDKPGEAYRRGLRANYWAGVLGAGGVQPPSAAPALPRNMTPGGFDPNNIDPKNLLQPAPASASPTTNNTTNSRSVSQKIENNVTIQGAGDTRMAGRIMESSLARVHSLALANAQSAVV